MLPPQLIYFFCTLAGRLLLHLLFWLAAAGFLIYFFGHFSADYRYTALFVCLQMPIVIATTYLINYFLIPRYLLLKRYGRFAWYFAFTLILSVWSTMLVVVWAFIVLADYRYNQMPPLTTDIFYLMVGLYFLVLFSTTVKLLKYWYSGQQQLSELRSQQLEAELQLLRGQIHPHFLFNTLNNLYGLALEKSDHMPDAILRLSGLLEALLYRSNTSQVPLLTELKLLEDYLSLEKLRFEDRLSVQWKVKGAVENYAIAPFLLFPFMENAFKHGFSGTSERLELQLNVEIEAGELLFYMRNSIAAVPASKFVAGGIGLQNVQKRLDLLYKHQHQLLLEPTENNYGVRLQLSLRPLTTSSYAII